MDCQKRVLLIDKQLETRDLLNSYLLNPEIGNHIPKKSIISRFFGKTSPVNENKNSDIVFKSPYSLDFAASQDDAINFFSKAIEAKQYYSLVVIDMDIGDLYGLIRKIWNDDPLSQIILSSSHPDSVFERLFHDKMCKANLLILKKPLNKAEFLQAALVLSEKYNSARMARLKMEEFENNLNSSSPSPVDVSDTGIFHLALINEMTQRKNAEIELQNAKNNLESIFMALPLALIVADVKGTVLQYNSYAEKLTKVKKDKLRGTILSESFPLLKQFDKDIDKVIESLQKEELRNVEYAIGDSCYFNIFICPLINGSTASGIVIMVDDITTDHKKDEYLRQAQKMDIVGNLASGIAHDFNNVLGAINAMFSSVRYSVQIAKNLDKLKEDVKNDLEVIDDAVKHGSDMVDQLRALAKNKELEFSRVDLVQVIEKVIRICRNTLPKSIEIVSTSYCGNKAEITAYPSQIEQILLNLCVNASHAMTIMRKADEKQGGTLTISVEKIFPSKQFTHVLPGACEGVYYLLRIWDTGIGMTQEVMKKIFDPFFTTKEKKGTGLGLSMVYNIIQQHKGFVEVYSEPGNGSVFNVFLPASLDDDSEKPEKMS